MSFKARVIISLFILTVPATASIQPYDPLFREGAQTDYLIVSASDSAIFTQARRFAELKREKGLKTKLIDVDSITQYCTGIDAPEKIRNCLKDAYMNEGVMWVLLFGNFDLVPGRRVQREDDDTLLIDTDTYFACLDGAWDLDHDGVYGEDYSEPEFRLVCRSDTDGNYVCDSVVLVNEGMDLVPDIYIGRLPVSNGDEAEAIVEKIIHYTYGPDVTSYNNGMVFLGHKVNGYRYQDSSTRIDDGSYYFRLLKDQFDSVGSEYADLLYDEIYEDRILPNGDIINDSIVRSVSEYAEILSRGYDVVFWTGHGSPRDIEISSVEPKNYFRIANVDTLTSNSFSNYITISCDVLRTERDTCIAKSFLMNPNGGAVSFSGATNYEYMYTKYQQYQAAADYMGFSGIRRISKAFALANRDEMNFYSETMRLNLYSHQYWGDPEMEIRSAFVSAADSFSIQSNNIGGKWIFTLSPPLDSVLVCLYKKSQVFERGYTRAGIIEFDTLNSGIEDIKITMTGKNILPTSVDLDANTVGIIHAVPAAVGCAPFQIRAFYSTPHVQIHIPSGMVPEEVIIYDIFGRRLESIRPEHSRFRWDLGIVSNGLYIIRARHKALSCQTRMIINK